MSCSLNVVAYLGRRELALMPNVSLGTCVNMFGVLSGSLHISLVSLMSNLSVFEYL